MTPNEVDARFRFFIIGAVRLMGVFLVGFGILIVRDVVLLPHEAGYGFIVVGLVETFVIPQLLARAWRTPPGSENNAGIE